MKLKIKKLITILIIATLLFVQVKPVLADLPTPPSVPDAPSVPSVPSIPSAPSVPSIPSVPSAPSVPSFPSFPSAPSVPNTSNYNYNNHNNNDDNNRTNSNSDTPGENVNNNQGTDQGSTNPPEPTNGIAESTPALTGTDNGGVDANGQVGDPAITTGDATTTGTSTVDANSNLAQGASGGDGSGISVSNSGNGADSNNSGSVTVVSDNNTNQTNGAVVGNDLGLKSNTGENDASRNVGSSTITTGDANTTGTMITAVNTNINGASVSEFNVVDDQNGDIVLDFAANCITGCDAGSTTVTNSGNGDNSTNTIDATQITNNNTFQQNDATVDNNMSLLANTGENTASRNTGGDSTITTGDANVVADVLTFVNNNLSGNVALGVVNIFGNLIGDIILPESVFQSLTCGTSCATGGVNVANTGNGDNSTNNISVTQTQNDATFQANTASIENNLIFNAQTGGNDVSRNTGGDNSITTGSSTVNAQVLNIANSNLDGGNWWLVIINRAGQWVGQIIGSPGSNFAGSSGSEFTIGPNGEITVTNSGNGADSVNNINVDQTTNNTTNQINNAAITNDINLAAITGNNTTSYNTGGNNSITTGDAKIVANLINFVNNNIKGGKLVVTMINVFGSWFGDFVAPGQKKSDSQQENLLAQANNNDSNQSGSDSNNNSNESTGQVQAAVKAISTDDPENSSIEGLIAVLATNTFKAKNLGITSIVNKDSNTKVTINLAWGLLLLPLIALFVLFRKRILFTKFLPRH